MALPMIYAGGRAGVSYLLRTKTGKTLATVGLYEASNAAWDWMFGTEAEDQAELVQELLEIRKQLNDPSTDSDELQELAERDTDIQEELEEMGITVEMKEAQTQNNKSNDMSNSVAEIEFDMEQDGQFTPKEFKRVRDSVRKLANLLGVSRTAISDIMREMSFLSRVGPDAVDDITDV
jgi:transcriptional regulator with XRE-family HTH domain